MERTQKATAEPYMELAGESDVAKEEVDVPADVEVVVWTLVKHWDVHTCNVSCCRPDKKC